MQQVKHLLESKGKEVYAVAPDAPVPGSLKNVYAELQADLGIPPAPSGDLTPWAASGRSLSVGRDEGITKLLFDEATHRLIGCAIVGPNAGELIAEAALAIEMGADAADIALTIHPHPTLSETVGMAAEMFEGTITDLIAPKRK